MKPLTIGDLARFSGLTVEAIRYYEAQKLLEKPSRSVSGYRQYSANVLRRLNFICKAKDLGFSLLEIRELLQLRTKTIESCAQVKDKADIKIRLIQAKMRELERLETALLSLSASCSKNTPQTGKCPILDLLDADER
ncbi:MAG: heavy metal-responsive transcriptional regulator [Proteobacteria bacterium]|nr:MAG: heavy metal-responsive transcriptional regulator [Pseudomonadota bacterium]